MDDNRDGITVSIGKYQRMFCPKGPRFRHDLDLEYLVENQSATIYSTNPNRVAIPDVIVKHAHW